jgi:acylglycerol lipase
MSSHATGYFKGFDGVKLFKQNWTNPTSKATLVFVHGYTEHSSRYTEFAEFLNNQQIDLYTFDQRGYGKSEGQRAYVDRFDHYLKDLDIFLKEQAPANKPIFLMGHSMGGLIVVKYGMDYSHNLSGIISSAAALQISEDISPILQKISGFLSIVVPKLKTIKLDTTHLSRDPAEVKKYNEDELIYHEGTYARTGAEILKATKETAIRFNKFSEPILILHGLADKITDAKGSQLLYDQCSSSDKNYIPYKESYHELLFEPEKKQVMGDIAKWMKERVSQS